VRLTAPVLQASDVQAAPVVEERKIGKPVVPVSIEEKMKEKADRFGWLTRIFGSGTGLGLGFLTGMDWRAILAVGGVTLVIFVLVFIFRHQAIAAVKEVRAELC
jgi:putative chitinase